MIRTQLTRCMSPCRLLPQGRLETKQMNAEASKAARVCLLDVGTVHVTAEILPFKQQRAHSISLVFVAPEATPICQPLDFAYIPLSQASLNSFSATYFWSRARALERRSCASHCDDATQLCYMEIHRLHKCLECRGPRSRHIAPHRKVALSAPELRTAVSLEEAYPAEDVDGDFIDQDPPLAVPEHLEQGEEVPALEPQDTMDEHAGAAVPVTKLFLALRTATRVTDCAACHVSNTRRRRRLQGTAASRELGQPGPAQ